MNTPMKQSGRFAAMLFLLTGLLLAHDDCSAQESVMDDSFVLNTKGMPPLPRVPPRTLINRSNLSQYLPHLSPAMAEMIRLGWVELPLTNTTSFDLETQYVELSRRNTGKAQIASQGFGLTGYQGGRPFNHDPQPGDPQAGEKIAWNFRYRPGDGGAISPIQWKYVDLNTGKLDRLLRVEVRFMKYKYRTRTVPRPDVQPNPSALYFASHLKVMDPPDLRNTQLLIQRFDDDSKNDDSYLYMPFQRRVRRLAPGQNTDAFLGSDVMIEDFEGYNARVSDMRWKYLESGYLFMPFFNHTEQSLSSEFNDPDGFQYIAFGGQGECFPNIQWQLRKVHVVEATPVRPDHPVSKRIFHFDAQTYEIGLTAIYDRKGTLWKVGILGKSHPDHHLPVNKGSGLPISDAGAMIDVQAKHCSTAQFKTIADPRLSQPGLFQVQSIRGD
ncbi:MAG: hypothetical protein RL758_2439 [Pseudomonadota bacterium]|jgi:Protein of unknown function (DUF1329)